MELDQIKAIITMMKENDLSEFSMEQDGLKIRIKRGPEGFQPTVTVAAPAPIALPVAPVPTPAAPAPAPAAPAAAPTDIKYITSPMVGTFYRAAAPDAPPYAEPGKAVEDESVVCIIEAMKVMNEIKADLKGVIVECLVENAKPVEFGQKLFAVRVK
ncbi:MAG: Biotin carboxyl carrier protein of acetyl-CoA carboxylase [Verrucomicrobiae bacterium]|nr:Biotin carboxyl carrier protein of acetyl-CoA carboxylase [Verrucomicrobiae bacterium]